MTATTTRLLKEARPLFWPWCVVTLAGLLPLLQPRLVVADTNWIEVMHGLGLIVGLPLLAVLSFGNEFQHRTLSLLLTEPLDRMGIWGEKLSVTAVAVLSVAAVYYFGWQTELLQIPGASLFFVACILAAIASAPFWTLLARSTLGGMTLSYAFPYFCFAAWGGWTDWRFKSIPAIVSYVVLGYAAVMLWLGRRKLARFQVTGGMAGDDLLMAGAGVMPAALAGWFRCRPHGAVLNLVRKELRLLRPIWLLTLLALLGWICVGPLGPVTEAVRGQSRPLEIVVLLLSSLSLLIAVLAGSLSLGEERTSGSHTWHMTLPVSARRQWAVKLSVALLTSAVCGVLLPALVVTAGRLLVGSTFKVVDSRAIVAWLLALSLVTLSSFWCACAVNGTVRAALWVFPVMSILLLAGRFGDWAGRELLGLMAARLDLFTGLGFTNAVANLRLYSREATPELVLALLWVPTLLFVVPQSYRLFRKQLQDRTWLAVRSLLPLALVAFLCTFSLAGYDAFVDQAKWQMWSMFRETHEAIEKVPGVAKLDAAHPLELTVEDLAKASSLSERTRRWLSNSRITVAPAHLDMGRPYCCGTNSRGITMVPDQPQSWYLATIQMPGGPSCTVSFMSMRGYGTLGGVCK